MANSSAVTSGEVATSTQYNDLRNDAIDTSTGHVHDGVNANGGVTKITDTTATTSTTTGALIVAGGVGIAADVVIGDDLSLLSDSSVFNMGVGSDFKITHDGTEGATLSGNPLTFDSGGDIILDAEGGDIFFKDGGTTFGSATNTSGNLIIKSGTTTAATFSGANVTLAGTVGSGAITSTGVVTGSGFTIGSAAILEDELEILDGASVTTTELNLIDGGTSRDTNAVASGDGILINDAGTMHMTNVDTVSTYFSSHSVGGGNIVTTGALDAGSITSGFTSIDVGAGAITTTGAISGGTIDAATDFTIGTTVITDDSIVMTPSSSDTVTIAAATNGALSITTVDTAAAAANIQITADGTVDINSAGVLTLDSGAAINIEPAAGSAILLDGTISIDGGVVTGATNVTLSGELDAATLDLSGAADIAGDLVVGTTLLFVDITDSQVGIGVANALSKFHVRASDASASIAGSEVIATFERAGHGYIQFLSNDDTESGILFGDNNSSSNDPSEADADIGSMVYKHSTNGFHFRTNATSNRFEIQDDGNIIGTHGTYHVASDQRVKKEVATISGALNKVAALRGVNFKWKDTDKGTALQMGLIAQEVEAVVPEVVNTASDTFINADGEYVRVAEGATPPSGVTGIKAVNYQFLVGLLIEAVKELKATVDAL